MNVHSPGRGKCDFSSLVHSIEDQGTRGEGGSGEPRPGHLPPEVFSESALGTHSSTQDCPSFRVGSLNMSKPQLLRASNQLRLPWGPAASWNASESRAKPQAALRRSSFQGFLLSLWGSRIQAPPAKSTDLYSLCIHCVMFSDPWPLPLGFSQMWPRPAGKPSPSSEIQSSSARVAPQGRSSEGKPPREKSNIDFSKCF